LLVVLVDPGGSAGMTVEVLDLLGYVFTRQVFATPLTSDDDDDLQYENLLAP
jgi:hypothetical protein